MDNKCSVMLPRDGRGAAPHGKRMGRFPPETGAPPGGAADTNDARGVVAEPTGDRQRNKQEIRRMTRH